MILIITMKRMEMIAYVHDVCRQNKRFSIAYAGVKRRFKNFSRLKVKIFKAKMNSCPFITAKLS